MTWKPDMVGWRRIFEVQTRCLGSYFAGVVRPGISASLQMTPFLTSSINWRATYYVALGLRGNETNMLKTCGNVTDKVFQKSEVRTREVLLWRWCGASRVLGVISCLCICKQHLSSTAHTRKLTRPCQTARGETRVSLIDKTEGAQLLKEQVHHAILKRWGVKWTPGPLISWGSFNMPWVLLAK